MGAGKPPNPFVQLLGFVAALVAFAIAVLIGGIFLAGLVGFVLLAVLVIYVRVWWLRRQLSAAGRAGPGNAGTPPEGEIVDGEYRVIDIADPDETKD